MNRCAADERETRRMGCTYKKKEEELAALNPHLSPEQVRQMFADIRTVLRRRTLPPNSGWEGLRNEGERERGKGRGGREERK